MKKLFFAVLIMLGLGTIAMAQTNPPGGAAPGTRRANSSYVDKNNNGVCDYYENRANFPGRNQGNVNGNRGGNGYGPGAGQCRRGGGYGRGYGRRGF